MNDISEETKFMIQEIKAMNWALDKIFDQGFGIKLKPAAKKEAKLNERFDKI